MAGQGQAFIRRVLSKLTVPGTEGTLLMSSMSLRADTKRLSKTINSATENNGNTGTIPQSNQSSKTAVFMDQIAGYPLLGRTDSATLQQGGKKIIKVKSGSMETKFNDGADHT